MQLCWQYKTPLSFENKTVLVMGIENSGGDMAVELGRIAKQVYLSTRRGTWVFNRVGSNGIPLDMTMKTPLYSLAKEHSCINDDLPNRIICGSVSFSMIIRKIDHIDCVLMATGFNIAFPYLDKKILHVQDNHVRLYKYVWPSGLIQPWGAINPMTELQARWAVGVFKNELKLPSRRQMNDNIDAKALQMSKRYVASPRHTVQVDHLDYCNEITDQIGCKPNLFNYLFKDFELGWMLLFGPSTPYRYRLEGPNPWSQARQAILTQYQRMNSRFSSKNKPNLNQFNWFLKLFLVIFIILLLIIIFK